MKTARILTLSTLVTTLFTGLQAAARQSERKLEAALAAAASLPPPSTRSASDRSSSSSSSSRPKERSLGQSMAIAEGIPAELVDEDADVRRADYERSEREAQRIRDVRNKVSDEVEGFDEDENAKRRAARAGIAAKPPVEVPPAVPDSPGSTGAEDTVIARDMMIVRVTIIKDAKGAVIGKKRENITRIKKEIVALSGVILASCDDPDATEFPIGDEHSLVKFTKNLGRWFEEVDLFYSTGGKDFEEHINLMSTVDLVEFVRFCSILNLEKILHSLVNTEKQLLIENLRARVLLDGMEATFAPLIELIKSGSDELKEIKDILTALFRKKHLKKLYEKQHIVGFSLPSPEDWKPLNTVIVWSKNNVMAIIDKYYHRIKLFKCSDTAISCIQHLGHEDADMLSWTPQPIEPEKRKNCNTTNMLVSASKPGIIRVWDIVAGKKWRCIQEIDTKGPIKSIKWNYDGTTLAVLKARSIEFWKRENTNTLSRSFTLPLAHEAEDFVFGHRNDYFVISYLSSKILEVWQKTEDGWKTTFSMPIKGDRRIKAAKLTLSPDDTVLIVDTAEYNEDESRSNNNHTLEIHSFVDGKLIHTQSENTYRPSNLAWNPDSNELSTHCVSWIKEKDGKWRLLDGVSNYDNGGGNAIAWNQDGHFFSEKMYWCSHRYLNIYDDNIIFFYTNIAFYLTQRSSYQLIILSVLGSLKEDLHEDELIVRSHDLLASIFLTFPATVGRQALGEIFGIPLPKDEMPTVRSEPIETIRRRQIAIVGGAAIVVAGIAAGTWFLGKKLFGKKK